MSDKVISVQMKDEFRICPTCGYVDGFHSMLKKENGTIKQLFICPSCHDIFDLGFTVRNQETG